MIELLAAASLAVQPAPLHPGQWSDVRSSRESGDYDGLALRIPAADARTVAVTLCAGGCSPEFAAPIVRTPTGFTFDVAEPMLDPAGRPATLPPRHCFARFDGDVLVVLWLREDIVDVLRRRARPLKLPRETPVLEKRASRSQIGSNGELVG